MSEIISTTAVPASGGLPEPPRPQYHFNVADEYAPRPDQAGLLETQLPNPALWGITPQDYVNWFNGLWYTGDPSRWGPHVFTPDAVMIDPTGRSIGAGPAASDFLLLFEYFPELRGQVVSWSHNDTEIMINWRFVISNGMVCPVIDKFSFVNGLVSFRQAYFDTTMLLSYLAANFGSAALTDYFIDRFWRTTKRGAGVLFVPALVKSLLKGLFLWADPPLAAPDNLTATPGPNAIRLRWDPVPNAKSYTVKRSTIEGGPYNWIAPYTQATSYEDSNVQPGVKYYYVVCSNVREQQLLTQQHSPRLSVRS